MHAGTAPFVVPSALDTEGTPLAASRARRGKGYICPCCAEPVIFRKGSTRLGDFHWEHKTSRFCTPERVEQAACKGLLLSALEGLIRSGRMLGVLRPCSMSSRCSNIYSENIRFPKSAEVVVDYVTPGTGWSIDVAVVDGGEALFGIEVSSSKHVGAAKAEGLKLPWVEVSALGVSAPARVLRPLQHNNLDEPRRCRWCETERRVFDAICKAITLSSGIAWSAPYEPLPQACWKCNELVLAFSWPDKQQYELSDPPEPRPSTIKFRRTSTAGHKYWANVCPHCKAVQGDHFISTQAGLLYDARLRPIIDEAYLHVWDDEEIAEATQALI